MMRRGALMVSARGGLCRRGPSSNFLDINCFNWLGATKRGRRAPFSSAAFFRRFELPLRSPRTAFVPSLLTFEDIVAKMDAIAPKPGRPKTYKKREAVG